MTAPLRKIVREFNGAHGVEKEELECGHVVNRKQDIYGATNAYRRRCKQCTKPKTREKAIALQPIIDAVQDSLDRFQVIYETGGDVEAAIVDLQINTSDLEDAVDKNSEAQ